MRHIIGPILWLLVQLVAYIGWAVQAFKGFLVSVATI